jgi:hypothetical protein
MRVATCGPHITISHFIPEDREELQLVEREKKDAEKTHVGLDAW